MKMPRSLSQAWHCFLSEAAPCNAGSQHQDGMGRVERKTVTSTGEHGESGCCGNLCGEMCGGSHGGVTVANTLMSLTRPSI
jgi:hypothetical protein